MIREPGLSFVGGSSGEGCRRRMEALGKCLNILQEDFVDPNERGRGFGSLSKALKVLLTCVENEDTDLLGFSSRRTQSDVDLSQCSGTSQRQARALCPSTQKENVEHLIPSSGGYGDRAALPSSGDRILKYLERKVKQERVTFAVTPARTCGQLTSFLFSSEGNGPHAPLIEEESGCDSPVEKMSPALRRDSKIKTPGNKHDVCREVSPQVQAAPAVGHQTTFSSESSSSPDVIIEEILEDDAETDEQSRRPFKMEAPIQQEAAELVLVSHIINPCHFYVQRLSQRPKVRALENKLKKFCCDECSCLLPSDILELGALTFIKNEETGKWCRGVITELIPQNSGNTRRPFKAMGYKVSEIALLEAFLIDFGSCVVLILSGFVPTERPESAALQVIETDDISWFVRKPDWRMEAELMAVPPLAVQCSLKDIVPRSERRVWEDEARTQFSTMVKNKTVLMVVFGKENGVLMVDLRKPRFNEAITRVPVSVKDALVFLDYARWHLPNQLEKIISQYSPAEIPQEREVSVVICHINSPGDFYLQLRENLESLQRRSLKFLPLSERIQEAYESENLENLEIVCPLDGQACIAKREDGRWCRARIVELLSDHEVVVKFVDFGNSACLPLADLRRVKKEFLSSPEEECCDMVLWDLIKGPSAFSSVGDNDAWSLGYDIAIRCRLACIQPYRGACEWSRKAKKRFEEITEHKVLQCIVLGISDNILSVELIDSAVHGRNFSVNCQLVEEDLASYISGSAVGASGDPTETWDAYSEEIAENPEALNHLEMESVDEDFNSLCKKGIQVRISHVVSPSKIFVQRLSSERKVKSLQEKMAAVYGESQPQSLKWESQMHCAAYISDVKKWQRGQISRVVTETSAEVMLYDSGAEKTVTVACLRKLEAKLEMMRALATECSLVDIRPTGESAQWTATVCEYLSDYLSGAQATVIVQESDGAGAVPVKILCRDEMGKLRDVSEHLVQKGLALRNRTDRADVTCPVSKKGLEVPSEQENPQLDGCDSESVCARNSAASKEVVTDTDSKQDLCPVNKPVLLGMDEVYKQIYKPAVLPQERIFQAVVSWVEHDGTIYVIPKSFEIPLNKLMMDIQSSFFNCLGLLETYHWKKGEACIVRGSDTMWYRGKVTGVGGSAVQVQYIDWGFRELIPQCHLYPTTLYTGVPPFCIHCQLYGIVPVGKVWQQDAVSCLQELLINEEVEIHIQKLPRNPWGKVSIRLYFGGMSLSSFMVYQKYCVAEGSEDTPELELLEGDAPVLPSYVLPSLPVPGDPFPVTVTHLVTPREVYICFSPKNLMQGSAAETDSSCQLEGLDEALRWCNKIVGYLPPLTYFHAEMPCLVEYQDGLWHRGKLLSVHQINPVKILVQFVDYGTYFVVPETRVRPMPCCLLKYPIRAVRALLAGIKPAPYDENMERIPYSPEWSMEALWAMVECVEGKELSASILALSPEVTISLCEADKTLVHQKLIEKGLAVLDE